ncbi:MAG: pyridoxamine 5'-phosphate oxidase family protein [Lachnospiraceae bacterium]|nr:pyridoxamine 5'-phosphate oxidase family protein [Lachnospiraceae bacterium]
MFRQMRRFKQQIPEADCIDLLKKAPRGVLSLIGDGGYPYGIPVNFVYEDGDIYIHCAGEGHKIDAIKACDKASFCVLDEGTQLEGDWDWLFHSVICFGRIREIEDRDEVLRKAALLGDKYFKEKGHTEREIRRVGHKVHMLEFTVEHMTGKEVSEN